MDTKPLLVPRKETQSHTPVTVDTSSLEIQLGYVCLLESGQGLSQIVLVRSVLQCNVWTNFKVLTM